MLEKDRAAPSNVLLRRKMVTRPFAPKSGLELGIKDALYAITAVSLISGFNIPGTSVPWFTLFVASTCAIDKNQFASRNSSILLVPPLILFISIHIASAFRGGLENGLFFVVQFITIFLFIWMFVVRYSVSDMEKFKIYFSALLIALLSYVVWWHVSQGLLVGWKRLPDPKAIFSLLPLMLVLSTRSKNNRLRQVTPLLLVAFAAIIFLSGERKAYFLLLLFLPLMFQLRNPATYIVPLVLLMLLPLAVSFDPTGYLGRQITTLEGFAQGRVVRTISNEGRSEALRIAFQTIREHPILGVGTKGQLEIARRIDPEAAAPHNEWVRVTAENGVIGVFFYAATVLWGLVGALRTRVLGRYRSRAEKEAALAFVAVLIMYVSFEALDFIVLLAFLLTPFVQYLRLLPQSPEPVAWRAAERGPLRRPALRPAPR